MSIREFSLKVTGEIEKALSQIEEHAGENLVDKIVESKRIFVAGAGRSGFVMRAFAMRLMHMGIEVYVVGETVTPSIKKSNLLIIGSGSGETESLVAMAKKAKAIGAFVALVTTFPESSIGKLADIIIRIPAPTPKVTSEFEIKSIQPMGNLFEQSLMIYMDSVIAGIMNKVGIDAETMFTRHANLE